MRSRVRRDDEGCERNVKAERERPCQGVVGRLRTCEALAEQFSKGGTGPPLRGNRRNQRALDKLDHPEARPAA